MRNDEAIQVIERRFGLFPATLRKGSQRIQVDAVEKCWTEMRQQQGQTFYHFRVRCGTDRYQLQEDTNSGLWTVQKAS